jgi:hypothetical protein
MARVHWNTAPRIDKGLTEDDPEYWEWDVSDPDNYLDDDDCPACRGRGDSGCLTCGGEGYV